MAEHLVQDGAEVDPRIDFPIRITLTHRECSVEDMFALAEALDLLEVHHHKEASERPIAVDVLEAARQQTLVLVTPLAKMHYGDLAAHVEALLEEATKVLGERARVDRVVFDIGRTGIGSDERATLDRIV